MPTVHGDRWTNIHAVLTFIVPVLIGLIAVKYQGKPHSPFDTHPITAFLSIFSLLLYCSLSLPLVAQLPAFHTTCGAPTLCFLRILFSSLTVALLTSLLFRGLSFFLLYLPLLMFFAAHLCSLLWKLLRLRRGIPPQLLPLTAADRHGVSEVQYPPAIYHSSSSVAQEENNVTVDVGISIA